MDQQGPFRADWESLQKYEVPEWYKDAKFGIFIHWGAYSVPAFGNEWYPRNMYVPESPEYKHHMATYGPQDKFGYKDFLPMFKAEHYDPVAWAELFKKSGAKYVVPVAEHHDGFAMYDSGLSDWTAAKMGPHRDTTGELGKAVRAAGLHFGVSSHRVEHNFFLGVGRSISSDVNDPQYAAFYGPAHNWLSAPWGVPLNDDFTYVSSAWADDWLARGAELVEKYHPDIVYFDWWIGQASIRPNLAKFAAFYYNSSLKYGDHVGVINYKDYAMQEHSGVLDLERGQLGDIRPLYWQTDTSVSNKSWGYIKDDTFKSPEFVVHQLIDIVSKNGNLLLNIGPRSDGTIPDRSAASASRCRRVAECEWGCDLRHSAVEDLWRRPNQSSGGIFSRHGHDALYSRRLSFHDQRQCAVRDRARLADQWRDRDSRARLDRRQRTCTVCCLVRKRCETPIRPAPGRPPCQDAGAGSRKIRVCTSRDLPLMREDLPLGRAKDHVQTG